MAAKIGIPWLRISIHALREEGDVDSVIIIYRSVIFLSTPSARRATPRPSKTQGLRFISIHALREEGDRRRAKIPLCFVISIHALREEGDLTDEATQRLLDKFLSTPSARRATEKGGFSYRKTIFLSTPSARRATVQPEHARGGSVISIHALREEGDLALHDLAADHRIFLSTPSARRATNTCECWEARTEISIHALREEGDWAKCRDHSHKWISIHALREEGDWAKCRDHSHKWISIHALREEGD